MENSRKGRKIFVQLQNGRIATMTSQQYQDYLKRIEKQAEENSSEETAEAAEEDEK